MKKADKDAVVPLFIQRIFIVTAIAMWFIQAVFSVFETFGNGSYIWLFQSSVWGMPALFFVLSVCFLHRRSKGRALLFWSVLLTVMGVLIYNMIQAAVEVLYEFIATHQATSLNSSFWSGSGSGLVAMIVGATLFVTSLLYLRKRKEI